MIKYLIPVIALMVIAGLKLNTVNAQGIATESYDLTLASIGDSLIDKHQPTNKIVIGKSLAQIDEEKRIAEAEQARLSSLLHSEGKVSDTDIEQNKQLARAIALDFYGEGQVDAFMEIIQRESGFNHRARNPSGACGMPQALPCDKMPGFGDDSLLARESTLIWAAVYIHLRYTNPQQALAWHDSKGWY